MFIKDQVNQSGPLGPLRGGRLRLRPAASPLSELLVPGLLHVAGRQRFIDGMNRRTDDADNGPSAALYSAGESITALRYSLRLARGRGKIEKIVEF